MLGYCTASQYTCASALLLVGCLCRPLLHDRGGGETGNTFVNNLGLRTLAVTRKISVNETDDAPRHSGSQTSTTTTLIMLPGNQPTPGFGWSFWRTSEGSLHSGPK